MRKLGVMFSPDVQISPILRRDFVDMINNFTLILFFMRSSSIHLSFRFHCSSQIFVYFNRWYANRVSYLKLEFWNDIMITISTNVLHITRFYNENIIIVIAIFSSQDLSLRIYVRPLSYSQSTIKITYLFDVN